MAGISCVDSCHSFGSPNILIPQQISLVGTTCLVVPLIEVLLFRTRIVKLYPHDSSLEDPYCLGPRIRSPRMKRFADRLREARVAAGLTQEQLGFVIGVTKSSVSAWENGRETPSFRLLPELRHHLERSLDELVCGLTPLDSSRISKSDLQYSPMSLLPAARNEKERALLMRYRNLPPKRQLALLDLIKPVD